MIEQVNKCTNEQIIKLLMVMENKRQKQMHGQKNMYSKRLDVFQAGVVRHSSVEEAGFRLGLKG